MKDELTLLKFTFVIGFMMCCICYGVLKLNEYEMCIACNLLTDLDFDTSWNDIGGLENIINEIKQTVILPFKHRALFRGSKLLQPPKGKQHREPLKRQLNQVLFH